VKRERERKKARKTHHVDSEGGCDSDEGEERRRRLSGLSAAP